MITTLPPDSKDKTKLGWVIYEEVAPAWQPYLPWEEEWMRGEPFIICPIHKEECNCIIEF
jgi:hypothetical protein